MFKYNAVISGSPQEGGRLGINPEGMTKNVLPSGM